MEQLLNSHIQPAPNLIKYLPTQNSITTKKNEPEIAPAKINKRKILQQKQQMNLITK